MPNQDYPTYNGIVPSWADIKVSITPEGGSVLDTADIIGIKTGEKVEVGKKRGASGGRVTARTTGSVDYECSMTLTQDGLLRLKQALMENAPERGNQLLISLVHFDIMIQFTPPGATDIFTKKIKGCRYMGASEDFKEGNDVNSAEVALDCIEIVEIIDGKEIVCL